MFFFRTGGKKRKKRKKERNKERHRTEIQGHPILLPAGVKSKVAFPSSFFFSAFFFFLVCLTDAHSVVHFGMMTNNEGNEGKGAERRQERRAKCPINQCWARNTEKKGAHFSISHGQGRHKDTNKQRRNKVSKMHITFGSSVEGYEYMYWVKTPKRA